MTLAEVKSKLEEINKRNNVHNADFEYLFKHLEASLQREEKLVEALKYYADQDNWTPTKSAESNLWSYTTIYDDSAANDCQTGGQRARNILSAHSKAIGELK